MGNSQKIYRARKADDKFTNQQGVVLGPSVSLLEKPKRSQQPRVEELKISSNRRNAKRILKEKRE